MVKYPQGIIRYSVDRVDVFHRPCWHYERRTVHSSMADGDGGGQRHQLPKKTDQDCKQSSAKIKNQHPRHRRIANWKKGRNKSQRPSLQIENICRGKYDLEDIKALMWHTAEHTAEPLGEDDYAEDEAFDGFGDDEKLQSDEKTRQHVMGVVETWQEHYVPGNSHIHIDESYFPCLSDGLEHGTDNQAQETKIELDMADFPDFPVASNVESDWDNCSESLEWELLSEISSVLSLEETKIFRANHINLSYRDALLNDMSKTSL